MEKRRIPVRLFKKTDASAEYEVPVEADVMHWFKKEGDSVSQGDELCELEAEKGSFSMDAPVSGKVADIRYPLKPGEVKIWKRGKPEQVGDTLFYDPPLCFIEVEESEVVPKEEKREVAAKPKISADAMSLMRELSCSMDEVLKFAAGKSRIERQDVLDYFTRLEDTKGGCEAVVKEDTGSPRVVPAARKRVQELGLDLSKIRGSGPDGEILLSDVEAQRHINISTYRVAAPRLWRTIAKNLDEGVRIPTADADMRFDLSLLVGFYRTYSDRFPYALWFPLVASLTRTLARPEFWLFNGYWDSESEEKPVVIRRAVHIGLSYDKGEMPRVNLAEGRIEGERLKILVLRDAQKKTLHELMDETRKLLDAAETKKVPLEFLSGYTFIFNNIGVLGHERGRSLLSGHIAAMVNLGRIDFASGQGTLQIVFDHRLIDGALTPHFLKAVYQEMTERVIPELKALLIQ